MNSMRVSAVFVGVVVDFVASRAAGILIGNPRDLDEARVLQARGEEVDPPPASVQEAHVDLAEVVLRELARQPLEADKRTDVRRADRRHEVVDDRLTARVAGQPGPAQHFERHHLGLVRQQPRHELSEGLRLGRSSDRSSTPLEAIVDRGDLGLPPHRPDGELARSGQPRHLRLQVPGAQKDLDLVPLPHPVHPSPRASGVPFFPQQESPARPWLGRRPARISGMDAVRISGTDPPYSTPS